MHAYLHTQAYIIKTECWAFSDLNFKNNLRVFKKSTFISFFDGIFKEKKKSLEAAGTYFLHNPLLLEIKNTYPIFLAV